MRLLALVPLAIVTALVLAGCSARDDPAPATTTEHSTLQSPNANSTPPSSGSATAPAQSVDLQGGQFKDGTRTVPSGTTITYTNKDAGSHTVTIHFAPDPASTLKFDDTLTKDQEASYTFTTAGTYHVWCKLHGTMTSGMTSTVTVTA